jgi:hypothetical protein
MTFTSLKVIQKHYYSITLITYSLLKSHSFTKTKVLQMRNYLYISLISACLCACSLKGFWASDDLPKNLVAIKRLPTVSMFEKLAQHHKNQDSVVFCQTRDVPKPQIFFVDHHKHQLSLDHFLSRYVIPLQNLSPHGIHQLRVFPELYEITCGNLVREKTLINDTENTVTTWRIDHFLDEERTVERIVNSIKLIQKNSFLTNIPLRAAVRTTDKPSYGRNLIARGIKIHRAPVLSPMEEFSKLSSSSYLEDQLLENDNLTKNTLATPPAFEDIDYFNTEIGTLETLQDSSAVRRFGWAALLNAKLFAKESSEKQPNLLIPFSWYIKHLQQRISSGTCIKARRLLNKKIRVHRIADPSAFCLRKVKASKNLTLVQFIENYIADDRTNYVETTEYEDITNYKAYFIQALLLSTEIDPAMAAGLNLRALSTFGSSNTFNLEVFTNESLYIDRFAQFHGPNTILVTQTPDLKNSCTTKFYRNQNSLFNSSFDSLKDGVHAAFASFWNKDNLRFLIKTNTKISAVATSILIEPVIKNQFQTTEITVRAGANRPNFILQKHKTTICEGKTDTPTKVDELVISEFFPPQQILGRNQLKRSTVYSKSHFKYDATQLIKNAVLFRYAQQVVNQKSFSTPSNRLLIDAKEYSATDVRILKVKQIK